MMNKYIPNMLISLVLIVLSIITYDTWKEASKIETLYYVVDVEKLYSSKQNKIKAFIQDGESMEVIEKAKNDFIEYAKETEKYLSSLSRKNNIVIFNKKAIFPTSNTIDLTERIMDAVQ